MKPSITAFILFHLLALVEQVVGQGERTTNHDSRVFWELQDGMENWTARQWDEWWQDIESQFAMEDQDFPEWIEQGNPTTISRHSEYSFSTMKASGNFRGYGKNHGGRGH